MKKKLKKFPKIFHEISSRFASDFLIAEQLNMQTIIKIQSIKFPLSLLPKALEKEKNMIFEEIFSKVLDNDKKLSFLLKKIK